MITARHDDPDVPEWLTVAEFYEWPPAGRPYERWHLLDGRPHLMPMNREQVVLQREAARVLKTFLPQPDGNVRVLTMAALNPLGSDRNLYAPAIAVSCEPASGAGFLYKPTVIAEIVTPQNHQIARVGVAMCKLIASLQEIIILDGLGACAAVHRRNERGVWVEPEHVFKDETLDLHSFSLKLPLNEVYQSVVPMAQPLGPDELSDDYWCEVNR